MRAGIAGLAAVVLAACGSDGPTAAAAPIAVRITAAAVSGGGMDQLAVTVRNDGGAGQYRVAVYDDATVGRVPGAPVTFAPRRRCESTPALINPGVVNAQSFVCNGAIIYWAVVEVQDGSSSAWVRTGCYTNTAASALAIAAVCGSELKAER